MKGAHGRILWVDLHSKSFREEQLPDEYYKKYLGGLGLGAKVCFDNIPKGADPMGPDNILGFLPGLLTATPTFFTGRVMAVGKSPLTGGWGDSNCGGSFPPAIKQAGFDGIFFKGMSEKPVYLFIDATTPALKMELRDAAHVWGRDTEATEEILKKECGGKVLCIGEAGEKLSLVSGMVCDGGRIAARSGLGAVMGVKKLKALVIKGNRKVDLHDSDAMKKLSSGFHKRFNRGFVLSKLNWGVILAGLVKFFARVPFSIRNEAFLWKQILRRYGTAGGGAFANEDGDSPVRNWRGSSWRDFPMRRALRISDNSIRKLEKKKFNCFACPLGCGGIMEIREGRFKTDRTHKPEYESTTSLGTLLLNDDLNSILEMNHMCNLSGMDTISAGGTLAFAADCFEAGILTEKDTGGLQLRWGNASAFIALLGMMIRREGLGDVLADGVRVASKKIGKGSEKYAIHAGGQELPMHDPRFDPGYGLAYEVDPTPGRHKIFSYFNAETMNIDRMLMGKTGSPVVLDREKFIYTGRGEFFALCTKFTHFCNSAGMCVFGLEVGADIPVFDWINALTGWNMSRDEFLKTGERIQTLRQAFNYREGIRPGDFRIPELVCGNPPLAHGPNRGRTLDMKSLVTDYYKAFGWDTASGRPSGERMRALGLEREEAQL